MQQLTRVGFAALFLGACLIELFIVLHARLKYTERSRTLLDGQQVSSGRVRFSAVTQRSDRGSTISESNATVVFDERAPPSHPKRREPSNNVSSSYLDKVIQDISGPWTSNETRKAGIRSKLNSVMDAHEFTVITKKMVNIGQKMMFAVTEKISRDMTKDVYELLPEKSPFANRTLKRCSVIGNGGILANSHCGPEIDRSDFVFRCNTPPLQGYEEDAGIKTNLSSINPNSVIATKYKRLSDPGHRSKFKYDMKKYGDILIPLYGVNADGYTNSKQALRLLRQRQSSTTRALVINPNHFRALAGIWKEMGLTSRMTTGFYLTSVALSLCDSVHLYGFWPLPIDAHHRPVPYHYYGKQNITNSVHDFIWEFDVLCQLHVKGALRMHTEPCQRT